MCTRRRAARSLRGYIAAPATSLAAVAPTLALEWHPSRNGSRTADDVTPGSRRLAAWLCPTCDHQWMSRVASRALDGNGCPRCAGQVALAGDPETLAVAQPELFEEVDQEAAVRLGIDPRRVHVHSQRPLPWRCRGNQGHRWTSSPAARMNGCVCPRCPSPTRMSSATERRLLDLLRRHFKDATGDAPAGTTGWPDGRGRLIPARCDVVIASHRLVVEYDGLRYHRTADRRRCNTDKTAALLAEGWRVVRIREEVGSRRYPASTSPRRGSNISPIATAVRCALTSIGSSRGWMTKIADTSPLLPSTPAKRAGRTSPIGSCGHLRECKWSQLVPHPRSEVDLRPLSFGSGRKGGRNVSAGQRRF